MECANETLVKEKNCGYIEVRTLALQICATVVHFLHSLSLSTCQRDLLLTKGKIPTTAQIKSRNVPTNHLTFPFQLISVYFPYVRNEELLKGSQ